MSSTEETFFEQLREILGDIGLATQDGVTAIIETDDNDVNKMLGRLAMLCMSYDGDVRLAMQRLSACFLLFFLAGREHQLRGYPAPITTTISDLEYIPDWVTEMFGGN